MSGVLIGVAVFAFVGLVLLGLVIADCRTEREEIGS